MPKTEEQCKKMRDDMKQKILKMASLYFAKNGFGNTKIGDLAKHIGIGQGTIYLYFKSKEELFEEIRKEADNKTEVRRLRLLAKLPIPAKTKIDRLSEEMSRRLADDEEFCVRITLLTQLLLEKENLYSVFFVTGNIFVFYSLCYRDYFFSLYSVCFLPVFQLL